MSPPAENPHVYRVSGLPSSHNCPDGYEGLAVASFEWDCLFSHVLDSLRQMSWVWQCATTSLWEAVFSSMTLDCFQRARVGCGLPSSILLGSAC